MTDFGGQHDVLLHKDTQYVRQSPLLVLLTLLFSLCLLTRILTGFSYVLSKRQVDRSVKKPGTIPYWIPGLGSAFAFGNDMQGLLSCGWYVNRTSDYTPQITYRLTYHQGFYE